MFTPFSLNKEIITGHVGAYICSQNPTACLENPVLTCRGTEALL